MGKKVIKRDGSRENFHPDKISRVLVVAGLEQVEAETIAAAVGKWADRHPNREISSLEIRDLVLTKLRKVNLHVANLFAWYQKTKEL